MTESINGLHSCKPGNDPVVGQIKTFTIEHRPAQNGKKAWIKIKSVPAEMGGIPHRILSAEPTGYTDKFNNVSYNLEVEALSGDGTCAGRQKSSRETSEPHTGAETQAAHITAQQAETGNGKIEAYARHAGHIFAIAWEESKTIMALIPSKDGEELSAFEWLDLRVRITQNIAIEVNKIIRKERF